MNKDTHLLNEHGSDGRGAPGSLELRHSTHLRIQHDHGQHTSQTNQPPLKGERRVAEPTSTLSSFLPPPFSPSLSWNLTTKPSKIQLSLIGTEPKRHERDHSSPRRDTPHSVFYKSTSVARCFRVPHRNFPRNFRDRTPPMPVGVKAEVNWNFD